MLPVPSFCRTVKSPKGTRRCASTFIPRADSGPACSPHGTAVPESKMSSGSGGSALLTFITCTLGRKRFPAGRVWQIPCRNGRRGGSHVQLDDVLVVQHVLARDRLAVVDAGPPDAGRLELLG